MMRGFSYIALSILIFIAFHTNAFSQNEQILPDDSLQTDSLAVDPDLIPFGDSIFVSDSILAGMDSLGIVDSIAAAELPPLPPPAKLIDSLLYYFSRHDYEFNVQENDLYPRNGAGFLYHEASYYTITALETPLRTTVSPFGLPGNRMTIRSNLSETTPYDRTIPADGRIDFDDIATGDIIRASVLEGPLAGYNSLAGNSSMLHLEPFEIPEGPAVSAFTVERGAYGYAYTRGRVARMLSPDLGFAFSTDYRKSDGLLANIDDDSYNVRTRVFRRFNRQTTLDASLGVYRRKGGYLSHRRVRRDQLWAVSLTRQEFFGGQITGKYNLDLSRSADISKTIRPRNTFGEISYLRQYRGGLYQASIRFGKEQYYINRYYAARYYGFADLSGFMPLMGGNMFLFMRAHDSENLDMIYEGSAGYSRAFGQRFKVVVSGGYLGRRPDLTDLYLDERTWPDGLKERGNLELSAEKKTSGNVSVYFTAEKFELSASANAGSAEDLIYYNRDYSGYPAIAIVPENDNVSYADFNLSGGFHGLWWFYGKTSATVRRIDSDRYGEQLPYSPRWQLYALLGLKYYVEKYNVYLRLFGDMTYTEKPLSYTLQELKTGAVATWGVNASLKDFTFYYMMHNALSQVQLLTEDYGVAGWYYSWGFAWKFMD